MIRSLIAAALALLAVPVAQSVSAQAEVRDYARDALVIEGLVNDHYAYLDRLPGERFALTPRLRDEAAKVDSERVLIRFAERALHLLADHHAITGSALKDSRAVFPSYGDLWIERCGTAFLVMQVRAGSPAATAGIRAGDRLAAIDGTPIDPAVARFWTDLGTGGGVERDSYAARVLAAGRRDRTRRLTLEREGALRQVVLPNLYADAPAEAELLTARADGGSLFITFHDSLGDADTIVAFDAAMSRAAPGQRVVLDLTDTPSGGNTTVARGIMGWFVIEPTAYQIHDWPAEERRTGIARRWIEQVLPRDGKRHDGPVTVRVGRWTGSMGEGLAIGFRAIGAQLEGSRMAGLRGAIYDHPLGESNLMIKLPTERLYVVDGTPREEVVPGGAPATPCSLLREYERQPPRR